MFRGANIFKKTNISCACLRDICLWSELNWFCSRRQSRRQKPCLFSLLKIDRLVLAHLYQCRQSACLCTVWLADVVMMLLHLTTCKPLLTMSNMSIGNHAHKEKAECSWVSCTTCEAIEDQRGEVSLINRHTNPQIEWAFTLLLSLLHLQATRHSLMVSTSIVVFPDPWSSSV